MEDNGIKKELLVQIRTIAAQNGVKKVILFGSRARGDHNRTSDIDLAVSGGNAAGFAADIEEETATLLEYDIVDLAKPINKELIESIKKEGKVLYEKSMIIFVLLLKPKRDI